MKVFYNFLELDNKVILNVFVVGILNWVFDVVKMNRVIYFLRLEMDEKELYEIVILIIKLLIGKFDLLDVVVIEGSDKNEVRNMFEEIK